MEVFWDLKAVKRQAEAVLTVGTFDGIHRGHRFIIDELRKMALSRGLTTTLVTFRPHPQVVLRSSDKPPLKILTTIDEKIELLRALGLDRVVVIKFDHQFSRISSVDFVRRILFDRIGFSHIALGHDHAFGRDREGNIDTLRKLAAEMDFEVEKLPAFRLDEQNVSSTSIRNLLLDGKVSEANHLLGRNYSLSGQVVQGDGRGKDLNFPTANIRCDSENKLIPGNGVYAVYVRYKGERLPGMMNIGVRPTFGETSHTIEVHIMGFDRDIYGESLTIDFVERIRNEMRFDTPQALVNQLVQDREMSKAIL
jgi:riboflavin kinase/FMN adenylyltransferase